MRIGSLDKRELLEVRVARLENHLLSNPGIDMRSLGLFPAPELIEVGTTRGKASVRAVRISLIGLPCVRRCDWISHSQEAIETPAVVGIMAKPYVTKPLISIIEHLYQPLRLAFVVTGLKLESAWICKQLW